MHKRILLAAAVIGMLAARMAPAMAGPQLLFDVNTGQVLSKSDIFARWYPASLTKLMTAYVTFRALQKGEVTLTSPVRITEKAYRQPPSKIGFPPGSVMTLDNALKMMLVKSANDIAMAVGQNVGGSEAAFVDRMNAEARRLGMVDTHFANPNGLYDPDNYTTARDLAVLVSAIRKDFPQYRDYFTIEAIGIGKKVLKNYDPLIGHFDGADGMKTGFICEGGFNIIGSATRDGRTLAAIVLGTYSAKERAVRAAQLLSLGFSQPDHGPLLASLTPPPSAAHDAATNMRQLVCNRKARKAHFAEEREDGDVDAQSYLHPRDHPLKVVMVGLGGATGPGGLPAPATASEQAADVPVPTPRPAYHAETPKPRPAHLRHRKRR